MRHNRDPRERIKHSPLPDTPLSLPNRWLKHWGDLPETQGYFSVVDQLCCPRRGSVLSLRLLPGSTLNFLIIK